MNKYKVGNRFIIEIEEAVNISTTPYTLYKIKGFNSLVFDDNGLDKLKSLESCFVPESRSSEEIYNEGMDETWELAKTIIGCSDKTYFTEDMLDEMFDTHNTVRIMSMHSPQEIKEKIEKYEKENIKVGDIVRYKSIQEEYINAIVVAIIKSKDSKYDDTLHCVRSDGTIMNNAKNGFEKTGKHIDITEILKQI